MKRDVDMDKREFLKTSGAFLAGTMLSPLAPGEQTAGRTNWSGNYTYSTDRLHQPQTIEEVQQVVKSCSKLRALGARHSFNGIADSTENQISLTHLNQMVLNRQAATVTVGAGVTYSQLAPYLEGQGYALHNLASLPQISVAGAIATATHGSGNKNGNLATAVTGLEVVTADGEVLTLSRERDGDRFQGTAVHLGAIGVITKVTLDGTADLSGQPSGLREPGHGSTGASPGGDLRQRLQRQSVHRLAESQDRPGMGQTAG